MENGNRVFISYAHEDIAEAKRLYHELRQHLINMWMDCEDLLPGQKWKNAISKAIQESAFFLILLSNNSLSKKGFIQKELKIALELLDEFPDNEIFIIPARIEKCEPSDGLIKDLHWVDLFDSYDQGIKKILKVVKSEQTDDPDELEMNISKQIDLSRVDLSKFENRKKWGGHYWLLHDDFDGDEYVYLFWNDQKKRLTKSYRSYTGSTWYKGYKLNKQEKEKVKVILNID